ncbi:unnamed protein product [Mytilus coruscus]|uniref:PiggyBac transposable element-derived protein domain-containing protein n=1 Tax=Mytilus coruscus TaxID=42192 RepID=A0A6J8DIG0_MYTCO|nr:unnamed protein product [Mytilus coruscus]
MFCRYANQVIQKKIRENTYHASFRLRLWTKFGKLTLTELKGFLATIFNMGIIRKPTIAMYWVKRSSQSTIWFIFKESLPIDSPFFFFIWLTTAKRHRGTPSPIILLPGLNPLLITQTCNLNDTIQPTDRELSIGASLAGTKARTVMTQYIPTKAHKFGIKLWMLVEATSGYMIHFYHTAESVMAPVPADDTKEAPKNAQNLLYGNTPCEPSNAAVTPEPSAAGERFLFIRQRELMCVAYKERQNRKTVRFVTSAVKASAPAHGHKPVVSSIYSKNMGGVDLNDMMSGIYDDKRKTKKQCGKRLQSTFFTEWY